MSQENVETVRRYWRANEDRGLDALPEFFDEQVVWRAIEGAPDDVGEMRGIEALRRYVEDWFGTFADITAVPIEVLGLDGDRVLAVVRVKGRARLSGVETELSYAIVYTLTDGKIVRGHEYVDRAAALDAAGREE
jgi:ketosteroid isomerase-like protein